MRTREWQNPDGPGSPAEQDLVAKIKIAVDEWMDEATRNGLILQVHVELSIADDPAEIDDPKNLRGTH